MSWIKLHRQIKDWEWYTDEPVRSLFIHLLLSVNYEDKKWRGLTIKRGQMQTSYGHLAQEIGTTVSKIRTACDKLVRTNEITRKSQAKGLVITVLEFDTWQDKHTQVATDLATKSQLNRKQIATTKEEKEYKEIKEEKKREVTRPQFVDVKKYFFEKIQNEFIAARESQKFFDYYESINWMRGKNKIKKWKSAAAGWINRMEKYDSANTNHQNNGQLTSLEGIREAAKLSLQNRREKSERFAHNGTRSGRRL